MSIPSHFLSFGTVLIIKNGINVKWFIQNNAIIPGEAQPFLNRNKKFLIRRVLFWPWICWSIEFISRFDILISDFLFLNKSINREYSDGVLFC